MGKRAVLSFMTILLAFATGPDTVQGRVELTHFTTVYLPAASQQRPEYDGGSVEKIAYDADGRLIYAVGEEVFHVIRFQEPDTLAIALTRYEDNVEFTDVKFCGGHVFMTVRNQTNPRDGVLRIYKGFTAGQADPFELVDEIPVGMQPDMVSVRENCRTLLVAVEGELFVDGASVVDPEGEIVIIHFPDNFTRDQATIKRLDLNAYNDRYDSLKATGVRFVYTGNGNKFSNDLEPEYITIDESSNKAYAVFQENNAIAEINLETDNITNMYGLGYKQWGYLDASDRDDGIQITYWPIRAWYLPDTLTFHQWEGRKLLFTANEGDAKEYDTPSFDETIRGADIAKSSLGDDIHEIVQDAIDKDSKLGRLQFSKIDGIDQSGKYNALYTYGARSFSIWDVTNPADDKPLPRVFDSGSQFEEMIALHCPYLFNRDDDDVDARSDNKGPEPESIAVGKMNDRLYIFIGIERPGIIAVYSIGSHASQAQFETIFCEGIPDESKPIRDLFDERKIYSMDPEDIR
ncbi:mesenchyme-specific cell surface glycoprotein [Plakobranchus ocellatus]|uniref:Mesenchyme-specific cell surface glycoprotein n=1 Tax=Plakobranchus ocellatus TaxID=259542 RepID=A0AAV3YSL8_9GAST|nr:mesenchyme-specific cell surface glycoprotein [Plakobranchus ocellatus]